MIVSVTFSGCCDSRVKVNVVKFTVSGSVLPPDEMSFRPM